MKLYVTWYDYDNDEPSKLSCMDDYIHDGHRKTWVCVDKNRVLEILFRIMPDYDPAVDGLTVYSGGE